MLARTTIAMVVMAILLSVGAAWAATAGPDDALGATSTTVQETSTTAAPGDGTPVTAAAADAGTVTYSLSNGVIGVVDVATNDGWASEIEVAQGVEIEVKFQNGTTRVDFNAEIEDGTVRVRVRTRAQAGGGPSTTMPSDTSTTMPGDTTSTTLPDAGSGSAVTAAAGNAGTVTYAVANGTITVLDVTANDGWSTEIEVGQGVEIEVKFESATMRVDFNAEFEDGLVRVRVRTRALDDDGGVTSTTFADDSDDDDDVTSTTIVDDSDGDDDDDSDDDDDNDDDDDDNGDDDDDDDGDDGDGDDGDDDDGDDD